MPLIFGTVDRNEPPPVQDMDRINLQMMNFERDRIAHAKWATTAAECVDFLEGKQWSEADLKKLKEESRPSITLNRIAPLYRILTGYFAQNQTEIKYRPGDDGIASDEVAETLTRTTKQINELNHQKWVDAQIFADGIASGRGYYDIRLDFAKNVLGQVAVSPVDPFSVYPDCDAEYFEPEKWGRVTLNRWMSLEEIYTLYGPAAMAQVWGWGAQGTTPSSGIWADDFDDQIGPERFFGMRNYLSTDATTFDQVAGATFLFQDYIDKQRKLIRVLDTQRYELRNCRFFVDLATGQKKIIPDTWDDAKIRRLMEFSMLQFQLLGIEPTLDVGTGVERRMRWTITAADRILFDRWSIYDSFTIVPYFAYFRRGQTRGMIHDLVDPQREINKRRSALLHIIMTTANSGWMIPKGSLDPDQLTKLEQSGSKPGIQLVYNVIGGQRPDRIEPAIAPTSLERIIHMDEANLKEISGINDSATGSLDRVQSGVAVKARVKQSIVGNETYFENYSRTQELVGLKILEIIQAHYTEERIIRTRGSMGQDNPVSINQQLADGRIINDITVGTYVAAVESTPMAETFQQAQFEDLMAMVEKGIIPAQLVLDVLVKVSASPFKDEIIRRLQMAGLAPMPGQQPGPMLPRAQGGAPPGAGQPGGEGDAGMIAPSGGMPEQGIPGPRPPGAPSTSTMPPGGGPTAAEPQPAGLAA